MSIAYAIAIFFYVPSEALSQTIPKQAEPGAIQRQLEKPDELKPVPEIDFPAQPVISAPEGSEKIRFKLKKVRIEGVSAFDDSIFIAMIKPHVGKEVSLTKIYEFAGKITTLYQKNDYVFSFATVPPQKIENGAVKIQVVEGRLDEVTFDWEHTPYSQDFIDIWKRIILADTPTNARTLKKILKYIYDVTGSKAELIYKPKSSGTETLGVGDLKVVMEKTPYAITAGFNNRGTRYVGPLQQDIGFQMNNILGGFERISIREYTAIPSTELRYGLFEFQLPITATGTFLAASFVKTFSRPGFSVSNLDLKSHSTKFELGLNHPVVNSFEREWRVLGSFDVYNSRTNILGVRPNSEDRMRSIRLGSSYRIASGLLDGSYFLKTELSQGLDVFDSRKSGSTNLSRENGRSDYTKITMDYQQRHSISPELAILLNGTGQYAFSQLLSPEEFAFGGSNFGRAFENSEIVGDHGAAGLAELQYLWKPDYMSNTLPYLQFYGFYDVGAIWKRDGSQSADRQTGASAGVGLRTKILERLNANIEVAQPLTRDVANDNTPDEDPRYFFNITSRF